MRALSIRQPWAWAIIHAGKDIENRSWPTNYRGPFLIHAAKAMTRREYDDCLHACIIATGRFPGDLAIPAFDQLERGGIVGKARIVDCISSSQSPWFFGPYGFVLADVEPVTFQPCKGALGFFNPCMEAA